MAFFLSLGSTLTELCHPFLSWLPPMPPVEQFQQEEFRAMCIPFPHCRVSRVILLSTLCGMSIKHSMLLMQRGKAALPMWSRWSDHKRASRECSQGPLGKVCRRKPWAGYTNRNEPLTSSSLLLRLQWFWTLPASAQTSYF